MDEANLIDLDLNQEPLLPSIGSNDLEPTRVRIEERFRQLQAVNTRVRQRQEQNYMGISRFPNEIHHQVGVRGGNLGGGIDKVVQRTTPEKGKRCKREGSHLVGKALEINCEVRKVDKEGGSFYDCNICLNLARDPILTCCGHLFCWECFYQVPDVDSTSKECPVCKGEVSNFTVTPIYGSGGSEDVCAENGLRIPPRPKAHRVESVRIV